VKIFINAATIVLPFRQRMFVAALSAGRRPAVMNVFAFQATMSSCIENFLGLKSRIFTRNCRLPITENHQIDKSLNRKINA